MAPFRARRLLCSLLGVFLTTGCEADPVGPVGGVAASLEVVSGDDQHAPAASVLPLPIRVRVVDGLGAPVEGVGVAFLAEAGSGVLSPATATTDADGIVSASWQLPGHTGTMHAVAAVEGLDAAPFSSTAVAGGAAVLQVLGSGEVVGEAGVAIDTAMRVRVVDRYANPVSGVAVTFQASAGGGAPGSASVPTDGDGIARTTWRIPATEGWHTLRAEAAGAAPITMHGVMFTPEPDARIAIGHRTGCVITDRLYCWGYNAAGQIGDGTTTDRDRPTPVTSAAQWRMVAVGDGGQFSNGAACAVTTAHQLYCWGSGVPGMTSTPGIVAGAPPSRAVTLGTGSACVLSTDHRVLCWGANGQGQLGNGSTTALTTPTEIQSGERFRAVAMGTNSACAITLAGRLLCWGSNSVGQLGDGTEMSRSLPTPIAADRRFSHVRVAALSACARELGGAWHCWGLDDFSRVSGEAVSLGRVREPRLLPHVPPTHDMVLGPDASCGLAVDGRATCWGDNRNTVLGDLGTTQQSTPIAVQSAWRFAQLAMGDLAACGITTSAEVVCWGENLSGGVGVADETFAAAPVRVEGVPPFIRITAGGGISCGLRPFGEAWCWGLGSAPQPVPGGHLFHEFEAGEAGACGLESDGEVWCWGNPALLGLDGDHDPTPRLVPGGHFFGAIAVGGTWACGTVSGLPWCWGNGRGTPSTNQSIPFRVGSSQPVASVMRAAGPYGGMCGVTPARRVQCWFPGRGLQGVTATLLATSFGPDPIDNLPNCTLLADGSTRCYDGNNFPPGTFTTALDGPCGIKDDRIARCWGHNQNGSLGIGPRDAFFGTPQPILGPVAFVEVSIGGTHGCGLTRFGEAWCWGTDRNLALGNGARFVFPTPQRIFALNGGIR